MLPVATNLRVIKTPWATYMIVTANVLIHFLVTWNTNFVISDRVARTFGFDPASFGNLSAMPTLATSVFLHGDLLHLFGNMVFLLVFGRRVENQLERINFLAFYLTVGITACLAHMLMEPDSSAPLIGASGAISGVLGAFFICNPKSADNIGSRSGPHLFSVPAHDLPSRLDLPPNMVFSAAFLGSKTARFKRGVLGSCRRISGRSTYGRLDLQLRIQRRTPSEPIESRCLTQTLKLLAASILKLRWL